MRASIVVILVLIIGLSVLPGWCQEYRATLIGQITDAQGAVVPGVKIAATHVATGAKFTTVSGSAGQYTLPFLAPGLFRVEAETDGFKRYLRDNILLTANAQVSLDIIMQVGALTESVTVTADAEMLSTASASIGQAVTGRQIGNMPMLGRAPMALAHLALGVIDGTSFAGSTRPFDNASISEYAMGGGQQRTNEILLDGSPNMSQDRRISFNPPIDSVQEVKVELFQSDAAYGNTAGGTVSIVTKGGTNQFHGATGLFNQITNLCATPFFVNRVGSPKPVTRFNQWGLTAGGPVMLPKVYNGKDRTFWYFGYDAIRDSYPKPFAATVPSTAMRNGDFSSLLAVSSAYQIYDPVTTVAEGTRRRRQPFPGNIIPPSRISSIAKNYLQFYPLPNAGGADGVNNYLGDTPRSDTFYSYLGRLDFNLGEKHKLLWNLHTNYRVEYKDNLFNNAASGQNNPRETWGSKLDDVYTMGPTLLLNTRLSWARYMNVITRPSSGFALTTLGFPQSLAQASLAAAMPLINFSDAMFDLGAPSAGQSDAFDTFQIFTALHKTSGAHNLKFGADLRMLRQSAVNYGNSSGSYVFDTNWVRGPLDNSSSAPNGQSLASFLLGLPTGGQFDINGYRTNQAYYAAFFVQDDWRANSQLSLNLGLRYERETGSVERFNRALAGFDFQSPNSVTAAAAAAYSASPIPELPAANFRAAGGPIYAGGGRRAIYSTASDAFSPRFGFAYTPSRLGRKTVFRGGVGVYFHTYGTTGVYQPGFSQTTPLVSTNDGYLTTSATLANPFPGGLLLPVGAAGGINTFLGQTITYFNPSLAQPYTLRWTLTIQRALSKDLVLETGYIGSHSLHLPVTKSLNGVPNKFLSTSPTRDQSTISRLTANVPNPFNGLLPGTTLNGATTTVEQLLRPYPQLNGQSGLRVDSDNEAYAIYHALLVRLEKRMSKGWLFSTNYTFSKMLEATSWLNAGDPAPRKTIASEDRPHRFVFSSTYDLPFGKGRAIGTTVGSWTNRLIGGWAVGGTYIIQSAPALAWGNVIYYGGDVKLIPRSIDGALDTTRFNTNSTQQLDRNLRTFHSAFGNLRADPINNAELSIIKNIAISERLNAQLRGEAFNALNRPQFSAPALVPSQSSFGKITTQENMARIVQLGLRLTW